jgi:hypothetical protein
MITAAKINCMEAMSMDAPLVDRNPRHDRLRLLSAWPLRFPSGRSRFWMQLLTPWGLKA